MLFPLGNKRWWILDQSSCNGAGEKWLNSRYILKVEPKGFADSWMRGIRE